MSTSQAVPNEEVKSQCQYSVDDMRSFNRSYVLFLILVGLLGNILTIVVFMASKLRHVPSSHYLTALAAADAGVLTCRFLAPLQMAYPSLLIGTCQLLIYANNVLACLSVWYVVGFTIERYVAVWYPLARLRWCTVRRTRCHILGATMVAVFFYLYVFIIVRLQRRGSQQRRQLNASISSVEGPTPDFDPNWDNDTICDVLPRYVQLALTLNYVDSVLTLILPLILIVGFNASIVFKLLWPLSHEKRASADDDNGNHPKKKISSRPTTDGHPGNQHLSNGTGQDATLLQASISTACGSVLAVDFRKHGGSSKRVDERVTRLLFIISSAFVVMNMPDHIVRMIIFALIESGRWKDLSLNAKCQFELCQQVTNTIFYTYFAVNFVLYNVVGGNFRRELRLLLRRCVTGVCKTVSRGSWNGDFIESVSLTISRPSIASSKIGHTKSSSKKKKALLMGKGRGDSGESEAIDDDLGRGDHDVSECGDQL